MDITVESLVCMLSREKDGTHRGLKIIIDENIVDENIISVIVKECSTHTN